MTTESFGDLSPQKSHMNHPLKFLLLACLLAAQTPKVIAQYHEGSAGAKRYKNTSRPSDLNKPSPIDRHDTVFIEEMTWMEVRDAKQDGKSTILIPTGGIEQNGPYVALGKHNYVLRQDCEAIARGLGDALVAPIVPFVPEGNHSPKSHHMRYPGTISITEETFERLLVDIATSFKVHGFEHIFLLGDSGDNQYGMERVAEQLSSRWRDEPTKVHYISEYYDPGAIEDWLKTKGIIEKDEGLHDRYRYEAQILTLEPEHIRLSQRLDAGLGSINGISLLPIERTYAIGWQLIAFQADRTIKAIKTRLKE